MSIRPDKDLIARFRQQLLEWSGLHGRKTLPWQLESTPYAVWVSEIMLQQTQVTTVISYYERFMQRFPEIHDLAAASEDEVLSYWSGLGYYSRARNLHKAAQSVVKELSGVVPESVEELEKLPGIGRSTAGAICSLGYGKYAPILDGNVKRVLSRVCCVAGWPGKSHVSRELWHLSELITPHQQAAAFNQAMMDLGALVCKRSAPDCTKCPLENLCRAKKESCINDYPAKKPRKVLPVRQTAMLVAVNQNGELLLEKRAPAGVWAGLWSFQQFETTEALEAWCSRQFGSVPKTKPLETRRHSFTHFHLDISPVHVQLENPANGVMDSDQLVWYKRSALVNIGIAAPVARIIEEI